MKQVIEISPIAMPQTCENWLGVIKRHPNYLKDKHVHWSSALRQPEKSNLSPSKFVDHLRLSQCKYRLSQVLDSDVKDKRVSRPSYLWHGDSYTGNTTSLYWDSPQKACNTPTRLPVSLIPIVESFGIHWVRQGSMNAMLDVGYAKSWQHL